MYSLSKVNTNTKPRPLKSTFCSVKWNVNTIKVNPSVYVNLHRNIALFLRRAEE